MTAEESGDQASSVQEATDAEYDPQYAPIVSLPEVQIPTHEEDEVEILNVRAKLYRFDRTDATPEWKERGLGELKMLKHPENKTVRIVMRRDKTLKVCANHFVTPLMDLKPKPGGQDKVYIYTSPADFTYEAIQSECFAIKFGTVEIAKQFEKAFLSAQNYVKEECKLYNGQLEEEEDSDDDNDFDDVEDDEDDDEEEGKDEGILKKLEEKRVENIEDTAHCSKSERNKNEDEEQISSVAEELGDLSVVDEKK